MSTFYTCTYAAKEVSEDVYEHGCAIQCRSIFAEPINIKSPSLRGLLKAIGQHYSLDIDDVFIADEEHDICHIGFNRMEDGDGDEPTAQEMDDWKKGNLTLYLADYHFSISKHIVCSIHKTEFDLSNIKTH